MRPGIDFDATRRAAPTPSQTAKRLLYADAARSSLHIESWDVPGAYSRADADPNVRQTMKQPIRSDGTENAPGKIAVMDKAMRGAGDANRLWVEHRDRCIMSWGWTRLTAEPSAFYISSDSNFSRLVADTDDFLVATYSPLYLEQVRHKFIQESQITIQKPVKQHANLRIDRTPTTLFVLNPKGINEVLRQHGMTDCNPSPSPQVDSHDLSTCRPDETTVPNVQSYQILVGSLRYFADTTHLAIAFIVGVLGRHLHQPTARHMAAVHRVQRYLRGVRDHGLTYTSSAGSITSLHLQAYSDSDWAQCPDSRLSTTGIVFTLAGAPIHWVSSKQATVELSSAEAEYIAAAHAARDLTWFIQLAQQWHIPLREPISNHRGPYDTPRPTTPFELRIDNKGAVDMASASDPT
jgi:Reverse transcriptase (RNA-dependent DNA polymerase)